MTETRQTHSRQRRLTTAADLEDDDRRRLETIVLTQVRDSLSLINQNMSRLDDNVKSMNDKVVTLLASRYDDQIAEMKRNFETYRDEQNRKAERLATESAEKERQAEMRFLEHDRLMTKLGLGYALNAFVGGVAITGLVGVLASKLFGAG